MSFEQMKFSKEIKDSIKRMDYDKATDVQLKTIPLILEGNNVIVKSHTGSGKTAAFGIPISDKIYSFKAKAALILCPTRELAIQVSRELQKINSKTRLKVTAFYGGHGMSGEMREIGHGIDILCATPGRLLDHFNQKNLDPRRFEIVVLDEADRMLDMGFISDLQEILNYTNPKKTHLFSATLDGGVAKIIQKHIPTYKEVIIKDEIIGKNIIEKKIKVQKEKRISTLAKVIDEANDGKVLVFVRTKRSTEFISRQLYRQNISSECIHGDKRQRAREIALRKFKTGKVKVLIATDVAARGLDIDNVEHVVNFDLASDEITHKHRIGRTGRMGKTGHAITFVGDDGRTIAKPERYDKKRNKSTRQHAKSFHGRKPHSKRNSRLPKHKRKQKNRHRHYTNS